MKLHSLYLKNFRGYREEVINFSENMNVIIGKNDIGKSTLMEALEIFFNGENKDALVKPEIEDCNVNSTEKVMEIGACFTFEEEEITIIDSSNPTSLKEEYLLNKDGLLEIRKVWDCSKDKITASSLKVYLVAHYPKGIDKPLITLKQEELRKELRTIADKIDDYDLINKNKNAEMRKALYKHLVNEDTEFETRFIEIQKIDKDSKNIWDKIKSNLPLYFLFQSDRTNSDNDSEVQNPLKIATKKALAEMEDQLSHIVEEVDKKVSAIAEDTINKLKDFNGEIANRLKTNLNLKSWDSLFSFQLESDDGIPLNKRGSGIRRLILLSYFRAEAERIAEEKNNKNIIYAIEEPETSQHPNFQRMIIDSLLKISSDDKHQVIITTHTPEIAKMVDLDSLIFISKDEYGPQIVRKEEEKLKGIVRSLGILPTIESKVVICVEGENDINFLRNINQAIDDFKDIIDLEKSNITMIGMKGSNLVNWVNRNYLRNSNVIEFHLYDNDREDYRKTIEEIKANRDGRRFGELTSKREMENYIPPELIEEEFGINLDLEKMDWDNIDVPKVLVSKGVMQHIKCPKKREEAIKERLNGQLSKKIRKEHLIYSNSYEEIKSWFEQIADLCDKNWYEQFLQTPHHSLK
ncbi:putative ATP-dependent endonuclease of OLD family [Thermolongibacillus altinsuensis]|jgi:predicted ATP-dependent endonuclease of OLD family|uniref:ATP-dependent OLD family endonuclease n=2 Tax=Anoxybacillaceae TaxID=3120669 RepID=C5DA37_GEOSW|nr:ATP-binding protein [Thermolongibacillus altinsuensis]TCL48437.1 putative ATP-dependent endonuclease of OLD family [Thermolongibacillus altinsuensis]